MKIRRHLWWILGGVFLLFCVGFVGAAYLCGWSATGFLNKSLWDWLQLLVVPLGLAVVALMFQLSNTHTERQIALDKQREDLLQAYLDRIAELLLKENLLQSALNSKEQNVARVRTVTVLAQLDVKRIEYVFAFLHESGLMSNKPNSSIISLNQANLRKINLSQVYLSGANLSGADLSGANLSGAYLSEPNLSRANLSRANLRGAFLKGASLSEANLSGAFLEGANLSGADFWKANLTAAQVTEDQLKKAQSLKGATMPDRSTHA